MQRTKLSVLCLFVVASATAKEADDKPYEFGWKSASDMSGAFMMCGLTGFILGDCPKVLRKCLTDPDLLKFKLFGVRSKCLDLFAFFTSGDDAKKAIDAANQTAGVNNQDHAKHSGVANDYEQTNDQKVTRESYKGTAYYKADLAAERLIDDDYNQYYYAGDGRGNGGWGNSDYDRNYFENYVYSGETPYEAYERAYQEVIDSTPCEIFDDEIEPRPRKAVPEPTKCPTDETIALAIEAGNNARSDAYSDRDSAYSNWRNQQGWDSYGYGRDSLENNYNTDRLTAYYDVFLHALENECQGNESCAQAVARRKISNLGLRN